VDFSIHNWPWELTTERWCEDPALAGEKRLSEGCVMLRDPDMRKLVSWVRAGTIVEIREK
jgi:hypothetical protein